MTEQMKKALDKAAKGLQWSQCCMLIDKKTLEPADPAVVPLERLVHLPIPDKLDMAAHFGANWYRNNVWHSPDEEPKHGEGYYEPMVVQYKPVKEECKGYEDFKDKRVFMTEKECRDWCKWQNGALKEIYNQLTNKTE